MKIVYNEDVMKFMSLFETLTGAHLKDCIIGERILFIVDPNEIGRAVGKRGVNVHKLEDILKKRVKMVEFNEDVAQFVKNFVYPLQVRDVSHEAGVVTITGTDMSNRGLLIGRERKNLNYLLDILKRYFQVTEIKVI